MRRIALIMLCAFVCALAGCEKEAAQSPEYKIKVNINSPQFGEGTKAARTGWLDEDEVTVMFPNITYEGCNILLILSFYEGEWTNYGFYLYDPNSPDMDNVIEISAPEDDDEENAIFTMVKDAADKKALALHCSSGPIDHIEIIDGATYFKSQALMSEMSELVLTCNDGSYSFNGEELVLDLNMVTKDVQISIAGMLDPENTESNVTYLLYTKQFTCTAGGVIKSEGVISAVDVKVYHEMGDVWPDMWCHKSTTDLVFYGEATDATDFAFELTKRTRQQIKASASDITYEYFNRSFTGKGKLKAGDAIIMNGPKDADNLNGWVKAE